MLETRESFFNARTVLIWIRRLLIVPFDRDERDSAARIRAGRVSPFVLLHHASRRLFVRRRNPSAVSGFDSRLTLVTHHPRPHAGLALPAIICHAQLVAHVVERQLVLFVVVDRFAVTLATRTIEFLVDNSAWLLVSRINMTPTSCSVPKRMANTRFGFRVATNTCLFAASTLTNTHVSATPERTLARNCTRPGMTLCDLAEGPAPMPKKPQFLTPTSTVCGYHMSIYVPDRQPHGWCERDLLSTRLLSLGTTWPQRTCALDSGTF